MPVYSIDGVAPQFADRASVFLARDCNVIGNVLIGCNVGIWFGVTIRGDNEPIEIGDDSNLQENVILHTDPGFPVRIGAGCTIGHRALLHGCSVGEGSLIGMGAIVLNGASIGSGSLVGAGALVTEGKSFPDRSLIVGAPARALRTLDDDAVARLRQSARHYVENARRFRTGLVAVE